MVNPVPSGWVSARFRQLPRNPATTWRACGWHSGIDLAAVEGAPIVAARGGIVRHVNFGSSFGPFQFAIEPGDGTRDTYSHTLDRPPNGARVATGQRVARVGSLGFSFGPHLHLERHRSLGAWSCAIVVDPQPSIDFTEGTWFDMASEADLRRVVRAEVERAIPEIATRVNGILGDFDNQGRARSGVADPERANVRLRRIWQRVNR